MSMYWTLSSWSFRFGVFRHLERCIYHIEQLCVYTI